MPYELENLQITSVDLVDQGANPDAHVCLMKRNFNQKAKEFVDGLLPKQERFIPLALQKCLEELPQEGVSFGLEEPVTKKNENLWKEEQQMTVEEQEILKQAEEISKKYQVETPQEVMESPTKEVEKSLEAPGLNPEVAKALKENAEVMKGYESKISQLEKSLAMKDLETIAKKYALLGNDSKELAEKFYTMQKSGAYEDYIAVLDQSMAMIEKSGMFTEVGKSGNGTPPSHHQLVEAVMKRDSCSKEVAFMKAYEENPDFALAYDQGYVQQ